MKECSCKSCGSNGILMGITLATLIGGATLGTLLFTKVNMMSQEINALYKWDVEKNFGSMENFQKVFDKMMTPEVRKSIEENVQLALSKTEDNQAGDSLSEEESLEKSVKTLQPEEMEELLSEVHIFNKKESDIVIVEYADFLCGHCKHLHESKTLEELSNEKENVSFAFVAVPLWEKSVKGQQGAYCAGKIGGHETFYKYVDAAFNKQPQNAEEAEAVAKEAGIDEAKFAKCLADANEEKKANEWFERGRKMFNVNGTPANFVINKKTGKYIAIGGAAHKERFEQIIEYLQ